MRKPLDLLVTTKTLAFVSRFNNPETAELYITESGDEPRLGLNYLVKNVCAKISAPLADKLDSVTGLLGVSKRAFIEAAISEALNHAEEVMTNEGLYDLLSESGCRDVEVESSAEEGGE